LLLFYPRLSASIVQVYVCREIEGVAYLRADLTIRCYETRWNFYAGLAVLFIILYIIGIPLLFFLSLLRTRAKFDRLDVIYVLADFYESYRPDSWWFEMVDMFHKFLISALVQLVPVNAYFPVGMVISYLYLAVILFHGPYWKPTDLRLHVLAQTELLLLMLAGLIWHELNLWLDPTSDIMMSVFLIALMVTFFLVFLQQIISEILNPRLEAAGKSGIHCHCVTRAFKRLVAFLERAEDVVYARVAHAAGWFNPAPLLAQASSLGTRSAFRSRKSTVGDAETPGSQSHRLLRYFSGPTTRKKSKSTPTEDHLSMLAQRASTASDDGVELAPITSPRSPSVSTPI